MKRQPKLEVYQGDDLHRPSARYYWRLRALNGECVAEAHAIPYDVAKMGWEEASRTPAWP